LFDRRDSAGAQRPAGRDEPRRPAPAPGARLRAARAVASQALPGAPGHDRALADRGALEPRVRRSRPARLLLPRPLVDLAGHLDPAKDAARSALRPRRLLAF